MIPTVENAMAQPLSRPKAVIFDWDNTLVDSWPVIHDALNTTFRAFGVPEWTFEETRAKVRKSMRDSFPAIFGDEWEQAGEVFYARYGDIHADAVIAANGAKDLLDWLEEEGIYLGVVSNKRGDYLRAEAESLGWAGYFHKIVGAFDAERDKPDPAPVHMALRPGGLNSDRDVWFVGDADIDMLCARNSGCTGILINPETPTDQAFGAHPPARHFTDCTLLCNFLQRM